jgi:hypothetical protein
MHSMHMRREIDLNKLMLWVEREGGIKPAALEISQKLECSISKAEKLAAGRYPSRLMPSEQIVMSKLLKVTRDELFPLVRARGNAS